MFTRQQPGVRKRNPLRAASVWLAEEDSWCVFSVFRIRFLVHGTVKDFMVAVAVGALCGL